MTAPPEEPAATAHDQLPNPTEYQAHLLKSIRINQLSPTGTTWLCHLLHALDSKDIDAYTRFMAADVAMTFNNGDFSLRGLAAVRHGLAHFWRSFGALRHEELNVYGDDSNFVHEALNHYVALDGRPVTVRAVAWVDRERSAEGKIVGLRVYNDQSPLWEGAGGETGR